MDSTTPTNENEDCWSRSFMLKPKYTGKYSGAEQSRSGNQEDVASRKYRIGEKYGESLKNTTRDSKW